MKRLILFATMLSMLFFMMGQEVESVDTLSANPLNGEGIKLGVALCGGSAKGYVHLGFLQALEEAGVKVDCISGTSMGAIMGMFYAAGYTPLEIVDIVKLVKFMKILLLANL